MPDHELRELRRELAAIERGPGKSYPPELRRRISAWARDVIAGGASMTATARTLALDLRTLRAWLRDATARSTALVPVEVVADEPAQRAGLRVVSPAGFRVEGLALDEVVALLQVLG
jgi:transposase-like protein